MASRLADRLRALFDPAELDLETSGTPTVTPSSTAGIQLACRTAAGLDGTVRVEGRGTWLPADAPCDLVVSTAALTRVEINADDLVVQAGAGTSLESLQSLAAEHGMWLGIDAPGAADRSLGSMVATGTSGPLRSGLGPVRDHILGATVITSEGTSITTGGRVVKNVAGYDLAKLQAGGFGAFGIIADMYLRLRALPRADLTLVATGPRDTLTASGRSLIEAGLETAAMELISPGMVDEEQWCLAARLLGTESGVSEQVDTISARSGLAWDRLGHPEASEFWRSLGRAACAGPVTLRLGVLATALDETIDLLTHRLDGAYLSAGALTGGLRWSGEVQPELLRDIRRTLALREIPLTLERAPWSIRSAVGHFGAYREGTGMLVSRLRQTFDPDRRLAVALEGNG